MESEKKKIDDGNLKIHELVDQRGRKAAKGKGLGRLFPIALQASMVPLEKDPWKDVPMIILKHRWMKNRNLVAGVTTVSFNHEGIAKVRDVGNARLDVEQLLRQYPGLIEVVGEQSEAPQTPPEPVKAPPAAKAVEPEKAAPEPAAEASEPETAEVESEEADAETDGSDDSAAPKRKAPPKRKK